MSDDSYDLCKHSPRPPLQFNDTPNPTPMNLSPSIRLLFSFIPKTHIIFLLLPAIFVSVIAGGVAPFMTYVVGQAFDSFSHFPLTDNPPQSAKDALLQGVGIAALELIGLAVAALALSSVTSCLWIWIGETNVMSLRKAVYASISQKDISWFDLHEDQVGAGGLMAKFLRDTDEVRMASSLATGTLIQYITTCITCLILAFIRSWALTLVILSALPLLVIIQGFSQAFAGPLLTYERQQSGIAATMIDRAVAAISTVKAFNASSFERSRATQVFGLLKDSSRRLNTLWAVTSGVSQFVVMAMFVQGFWFGSKLVHDGHISAGDVMAVFWACLIASSNLQMCIPQLIVLTKGKLAMVALLTLMDVPKVQLSKTRPQKSTGGLALYNVTFAYPSRPTILALSDVSLFLPANETTFIVGSSGSGKSTVAHLLLKLYEPQRGSIKLDDWDLRLLDENWLRSHVACVGQQGAAGVVIFDEKTVIDNIAAALHGHEEEAPTLKDIQDACQAALMHEFVRDLPQCYDTLLGGGAGVGLSGGQKQRLSIARARLRNPTVLILDEATSALDATSRILVFEALKRWRRNKTTIVITHDLSQIEPPDFVYVLKDGRVVEQGYRSDLEKVAVNSHRGDRGEFRKMMESQRETGGFLPEKPVITDKKSIDDLKEEFNQDQDLDQGKLPGYLKHQSMTFRPLTFGTWMFDLVGDLVGSNSFIASPPSAVSSSDLHRLSRVTTDDKYTNRPDRQQRTTSAYFPSEAAPRASLAAYSAPARRSLPPTPTLATFTVEQGMTTILDNDDEFVKQKSTMVRSAITARQARTIPAGTSRTRRSGSKDAAQSYAKVERTANDHSPSCSLNGLDDDEPRLHFWHLMWSAYTFIPCKPLLFVGFVVCILSGATTPIFSFVLARLLFEVSIGAHNVDTINLFGGLVLGIAAIDGLFLALKYLIMEICAMEWVTEMRKVAFSQVLAQDKKWFDKPQHGAARIVQAMVKDGDDARDLIAVVWGQFCVVVSMVAVGLLWAFIRGWQLTLAGLAIGPVFAITMAVQSTLVAKCEVRNKRAREEVAKEYYDTIINIRGIRSMAFDGAFKARFEASVDQSLATGVRGAFVEGCTYGIANGLIYLAEALLFYVGALLIAKGTYTYLQMIEVLNLVVFTVTIGSQLMAFTQKIAKVTQATSDFDKLATLGTKTDESRGSFLPEIAGTITFNNVDFSYPERPEVPILRNLNFKVSPGECVAVVGASGCGKSTIASLLQRLYEPTVGSVTIGEIDTRLINITHLRDHVSVVSQQPHLFDASIAENIRYGHPSISDVDIRYAARAANIHDFIMSLPDGYQTHVGENASLISGGQAQRLQIARALARPSKILILDECTSSLDVESQAAVLETLRGAKHGRTMMMITHNLNAMLICDRILVVHEGELVEEGSYDRLMAPNGVFATLARGGEWVA